MWTAIEWRAAYREAGRAVVGHVLGFAPLEVSLEGCEGLESYTTFPDLAEPSEAASLAAVAFWPAERLFDPAAAYCGVGTETPAALVPLTAEVHARAADLVQRHAGAVQALAGWLVQERHLAGDRLAQLLDLAMEGR